MGVKDKLAALPDKPAGVVLIFKAMWYSIYVGVMLFCLIVVGFLFGLETLAYFSLGILIVVVPVAAYFLAGRLLKLIKKSR